MKDYYEILGINQDSSVGEIRNAYRKKAKKTHPDLFPMDKPDEKRKRQHSFVQLTHAYEVLSDRDKRRNYDRKRIFNQPQTKSTKNQNERSTSSYSFNYKTNYQKNKHHHKNTQDPEEALNDLLNEVGELMNQFGITFNDPLEMFVRWAKKVFQEIPDLWDDETEIKKSGVKSHENSSRESPGQVSKEWFDELKEELKRMKIHNQSQASEKSTGEANLHCRSSDQDIERELKLLKQKYQDL